MKHPRLPLASEAKLQRRLRVERRASPLATYNTWCSPSDLSSSGDAGRMANAKAAFARSYGITVSAEDWPATGIPSTIVHDHGPLEPRIQARAGSQKSGLEIQS